MSESETVCMKEQLINLIVSSINRWTDTDIYAISLFVYDEEDNPCKPTVTLGYNTESQFKAELPDADDEAEARWNYAFWLQNDFLCFGADDTAETVRDWLAENDLPFYEFEAIPWDNRKEYAKIDRITPAFVDVLVDAVKEIHRRKILTAKFGRELPIIIHELEYYDEIAEQNIRANGDLIDKSFIEFCRGE